MTKKIRKNGMTRCGLILGDATIRFFLIMASNRIGLAAWAAELIEEFCERETLRLAASAMSRAAAASADVNGHIRPHHYRHGKAGHHCKKDRLHIWFYDELPRKNSRTAKSCHRPKKGRMAGIRKHY